MKQGLLCTVTFIKIATLQKNSPIKQFEMKSILKLHPGKQNDGRMYYKTV